MDERSGTSERRSAALGCAVFLGIALWAGAWLAAAYFWFMLAWGQADGATITPTYWLPVWLLGIGGPALGILVMWMGGRN